MKDRSAVVDQVEAVQGPHASDVVGYFAEASGPLLTPHVSRGTLRPAGSASAGTGRSPGATGYGRGTARGFHGRDGVDEGVNLGA
jgi:hypothetical protein